MDTSLRTRLNYPLLVIKYGLLFTAFAWNSTKARTFYVRPGGNDDLSGLSLTEAWASTAKISTTDFEAGDSILLEGGSTFTGGMYFSEEDSAQISTPLYISSYGAARATIDAGKGFGLYAYNVGTIHVHNIDFRGLDPDSSSQAGIYFYTDDPSGKKYKQVTLTNIDVSNFESGIQFGSWHSSYSGYSKVFISRVHAYHNLENGISTFDRAEQTTTLLAHDSFQISYCYLEDNGFSGLVLGGVNGALVERVKASRTGQLHNKGIVGIWTWNAKDITFRYCVADSTRTDGGDGGGFDIDGGTEHCIIQYCYAFFNDGPGFMHCDYPKSRPTRNNMIRYNISESDGQQPFRDKCSMAFISWGTGLDNCSFYNNTCYTGNKGHGNINCLQAYILDDHDDKPMLQRCSAFNNILYAAGDSNKLVRFSNGRDFTIDTNSLKLVANNYFASKAASASWEDGSGTYTLFSDWQSASGQESLLGKKWGMSSNPDLKSPGNTGPISFAQIDSLHYLLTGYMLQATSVVTDSGLHLPHIFGTAIGAYDFFGNPALHGSSQDIGAHENQHLLFNAPVPTPLASVYPNPCRDAYVLSLPSSRLPAAYTLYNQAGQTVQQGQAIQNPERIDARDLAPGTYYLQLAGEPSLLPLLKR